MEGKPDLNNALHLHLGRQRGSALPLHRICSASASWPRRWLLLRVAYRQPAEPATTEGRTGGPGQRAVEGYRHLRHASTSSLGSRGRVQGHAAGGGALAVAGARC